MWTALHEGLVHSADACFVLDLLNFLPILLLEVFQSKSHAIQEVGVVEVPQRHDEWDVEDDLLQLFYPIEGIPIFGEAACPDGFVEECKKVKNAGVPHEVHIQGSPINMFIIDEVKVGEGVCPDICEGQNRIEQDEERQFGRYNVPGYKVSFQNQGKHQT